MTFIEKIDSQIDNYNKSQQEIPKRIRKENPNLPEEFLEMLINLKTKKNRVMLAIDAFSFNLELNDIKPETEDELLDIAIAKEKIKFIMGMITSGKEL